MIEIADPPSPSDAVARGARLLAPWGQRSTALTANQAAGRRDRGRSLAKAKPVQLGERGVQS